MALINCPVALMFDFSGFIVVFDFAHSERNLLVLIAHFQVPLVLFKMTHEGFPSMLGASGLDQCIGAHA